jgi:putative spermidine/putrescine transport system permease protein
VDAFGYAQKPYSPQRRGESKVSRRNKKIFSVFSAKLNVLSDSAVNRGRDTLKVFDQVRVSRMFRKVRPRSFDVPVRSYGRIALSVWTVSVLVFLVAPVLIIVPMSFGETAYLSFPPRGFTLDWYARYLEDSDWMAATALSFRVAIVTAVLSVALGTLAAIGLVRGEYRAKSVVFFIVLAPLIVPVIVSAVAVYFVLVRMQLVGNFWAFVIAHVVLATPVVLLVVSAALRRVDQSLERAATILGATRARAFLEVTLPVLRPALISALLFAFITSFDEIVMALFLAGTTSATLPKRMWESLRFQIDPTIAAISTLLIVLSLLVLAGAAALRRPAAK